MKKNLILVGMYALFCLPAAALFAQNADSTATTDTVKYWKTNFKFALNVNQASFSSNWKAGGVNSIGLSSLLNVKANYKKNKSSWDNEIDLLFGFVNNDGQGYRKTQDRIFLDTKYGYDLSKHWSFYTSLNFLSQFAPGYVYNDDGTKTIISDGFAPAFLTSSWGLEYHPVDYFKVRVSPFSPRFTFVSDVERFVTPANPEPYGVAPPDNMRTEWLAFQLLADFNKDIATNLNLKWRYIMYANYETLELKTIDHRLDLNITAKVNKFINVSLGGILLYDYDQDSGAQLSQLLNIGFLYTFQNYKEEK
ncbi:MAG: DUF3078 domain-containing protein [Bacteroidia bacterium]|nr:DUF3078 domain-containing protein [Bacteroidia bacterium]